MARLDPAFGARRLKPGGFHCVPIDSLEVEVPFQPDGVEALANEPIRLVIAEFRIEKGSGGMRPK